MKLDLQPSFTYKPREKTLNQKLENIDKHQRHCFKEIDGKLYASFITNEQGVFLLAKDWNKNFIKTNFKKIKRVRKITQLSIYD